MATIQLELDFTRPIEAVMRDERLRTYPRKLRAQDVEELFDEWCRLNADALAEMELLALALDMGGKTVSAKYLVEKQRYEGHASLVGVPWQDERGHRHTYTINNDHTALLGRWLLKRHPFMRVERRRSRFDREGDAA